MTGEKTKLAETEKKKTGAKEYSLFAQIFASVWIIVLTLCKGFGIVSLETNDIIYSGIAIAKTQRGKKRIKNTMKAKKQK